ncbi:MAG: hypothetical protein LBH25_04580 [Fibromonadaceae bacterium]|jgi:hypothetical protein|nr:hypothetical protein [Fibromonadaceae bacterium]
MMQSKNFFSGRIPEDYPLVEIPYPREKLDLATPVLETFRREWNNSEYVKKYGVSSNIAKTP